MSLDFTKIDDEQLLDLIKAAMAEAVSRGAAVAYAAEEIYIDAAQELRIKAEVAQRVAAKEAVERVKRIEQQTEAELLAAKREEEREKQQSLWAKKAAIVTALLEDPLFKSDREKGFNINIWEGSDVRVYIQEGHKNGWEIIYYQTGNRYHPPGKITGLEDPKDAERMARFCDQLFKSGWRPGLRLNTKDISNGIEPNEKHLNAYRVALGQKEASNV